MKKYEQQYEMVFNNPSTLKKCDITQVNTVDDTDIDAYILQLKSSMRELQLSLFKDMVKVEWLIRKFCYRGNTKKPRGSNGRDMDSAFGVFMRHYVGYTNKLLTEDVYLRRVATYLDDLFVGFDESNPFKELIDFPFTYMNFECMSLVYRMPERMGLLRYGEEQHMTMDRFFDYVLNYIHCYNEEHGDKYVWIYLERYPFVTIINEETNGRKRKKTETSSLH